MLNYSVNVNIYSTTKLFVIHFTSYLMISASTMVDMYLFTKSKAHDLVILYTFRWEMMLNNSKVWLTDFFYKTNYVSTRCLIANRNFFVISFYDHFELNKTKPNGIVLANDKRSVKLWCAKKYLFIMIASMTLVVEY